jgi:MFS family permease
MAPAKRKRAPAARLLRIRAVAGLAGAGTVLILLAALGHRYTSDCLNAGGELDACWDKGLAIAGMGAGGPLSAGVVLGYIVGTVNKEKEKEERYEEGYWTLNPELHRENP